MAHELTSISAKIPKGYRETFAHLSGQVLWLQEKWQQYDGLFGFSQARIDLLNDGGSFLIYILDHLFIDDLTISLCRLLDPSHSRDNTGKKVPNLSFHYLRFQLERDGHLEIAGELKDVLTKMKTTADALQKRRHKHIAHNDYAITVSEQDLLPPVSRALIKEMLANAESFLKKFEQFFTKEDVDTTFVATGHGYETLLTCLGKARAYDHLVKEGKVSGNWREQANLIDVE